MTYLAPSIAPTHYMADTADSSKKKKKKPGEADEAVAQKVKTEKKSGMKGEYEGDDAERKRKAAGAVVENATSLAREGTPSDDDSGSDSASDSRPSSEPDFAGPRLPMT